MFASANSFAALAASSSSSSSVFGNSANSQPLQQQSPSFANPHTSSTSATHSSFANSNSFAASKSAFGTVQNSNSFNTFAPATTASNSVEKPPIP